MLDGFSPAVLFSKHVRTPLFPPWRRFVAARDDFYALARDALAARRAGKASGDDILGMLIDARFDDGAAMSDEEIHAHLLTLLIAGHETTAIALAWGAYFLAREPEILAKLRVELRGVSATDAIARLPFLGAVCDETLRVRPVVPDVVRPVREATSIGEWKVPAGDAIIIALQAILSDPAVFPDPERFRPERFLERKFSPAEFPPFGGGHRRCLGATFAEMELRVVLATLAAGWDIELVDGDPEPSVRRNVTMAPGRGVRVRLRRRAHQD
jgi:cytochrome P450